MRLNAIIIVSISDVKALFTLTTIEQATLSWLSFVTAWSLCERNPSRLVAIIAYIQPRQKQCTDDIFYRCALVSIPF